MMPYIYLSVSRACLKLKKSVAFTGKNVYLRRKDCEVFVEMEE